ncbi:acyltransferase family protein [Tunturiibacter psychrotolerans]|uniref:acyltransferase family protein n=1 Tax=Tunturiibacter psychrotolerans TaxID=3069686 RepID=UPI003D24CEA0
MIQRPRLAALTGLRFFAALYVVVFHTAIQSAPQYQAPKLWLIFLGHGDLAVSLFFILSGYVLTYNYADRWEHTSFMKFLGARFARIYPVYLLALLLQLPFWRTATTFRSLAVLFMVQSWTVRPSGLPGEWDYPAWTLSVEWFFYLCFPLLLWGFAKAKNKMAAPWLTCLLIIVVGGPLVSIGGRVSWLSTHVPMPLLRLPEFFLGMLLVRYSPSRSFSGFSAEIATVSLGIFLLALNPHRFVTLIILPFAAIIWLLANKRSLFCRVLELKPIVLLGEASYAMYLLQVPMPNYFRTYFQHPLSFREGSFCIAALIPISLFVFVWFEEPARRRIRTLHALKASTGSWLRQRS